MVLSIQSTMVHVWEVFENEAHIYVMYAGWAYSSKWWWETVQREIPEKYMRSIWEVYENQADIYVQRGEAYNSKWKHGEFHFFLICNEFLLELLLLAQLQFTFHSPLQSNEMQVASYQRNTTNTYLTAIFLKFNQSLFREINWFQFQ